MMRDVTLEQILRLPPDTSINVTFPSNMVITTVWYRYTCKPCRGIGMKDPRYTYLTFFMLQELPRDMIVQGEGFGGWLDVSAGWLIDNDINNLDYRVSNAALYRYRCRLGKLL